MGEGVYYYRPVKKSHKSFCLATLEKLTKYCLGGSNIVLKINPRVTGDRPLMSIVYKYNYGKVLGFISTEGSGSTEPGDPYLSRFPGSYYNVSILPVFFPHLLVSSFNAFNAIYNHSTCGSLT